jgi:cobyrinic acid a,c-diamide synthase
VLFPAPIPRLVVAGTSGDSGKTIVSLALLLAARERGLSLRAFKKGPDYIDAAWLGRACGCAARHLDTFLMGFPRAVETFCRYATGDLNVVEGNRGIFDGADARGTHSTAELAKALKAPVVLTLNAVKMTRTAAAWVAGCQALDPGLRVAGVIINQVNGARHERVLREAIESACNVPVLGVIPRLAADALLPERHLGLVTPEEYGAASSLDRELARLGRHCLELDRIFALAAAAKPLAVIAGPEPDVPDGRGLKIAYLRDSAFTFYYPENLEALERSGAELVPVSALAARELPATIDALYIGGGFPETHAAALSANAGFLRSLRERVRRALPVYAECGGLMLLSRAILWQGARHEMAGVLPFDVEVCPTPQGHGYAELAVDRDNPFFAAGTVLKGHEFHYSRILVDGEPPATACAVRRGTGCYGRRDGVLTGNVWAGYTHFHAVATPEWAQGILRAAQRFAHDRRHAYELSLLEVIA